MPQRAVAGICCRALPLAFVLLDAVLVAPTPRPATATNPAALAHKQPRRWAGLRAGRGGAGGDNNTTAVGGGGPRGHARAGNININNVSTGDRGDNANQARSGEVSNKDLVGESTPFSNKDLVGESTPANDLRSSCTAYTDASCPSGDRVKRGPDWKWGSQDGGDGHGTVQSDDGAGWCEVRWDNGGSNNYRVGYNGAYDLCRLAPGSTGSSSSPSPAPSSSTRCAVPSARIKVSFAR